MRMGMGWGVLLLAAAGCSPAVETAADNSVVMDMNASEGMDVAEGPEPEAAGGWSFSDRTDPITDERFYTAATQVKGQTHDLAVTVNCALADGVPAFTIDGFDKVGEGASFAYAEAVQFRGDRGDAYQLTSNNTRFSNSRVLRPLGGDLDSWMPFLGSRLTIRVPFSNGDGLFDVSLDDDNFRSAMTPCVTRWKQMRAEQVAAEREAARAERADQAMRDAVDAPAPPPAVGADNGMMSDELP